MKVFRGLVCKKYFVFHPQGEAEGIRSSDTYVMTDVRRNATGEYKCSLLDKSMMDSTTITVHCKWLHFAFLVRQETYLVLSEMAFLLDLGRSVQLTYRRTEWCDWYKACHVFGFILFAFSVCLGWLVCLFILLFAWFFWFVFFFTFLNVFLFENLNFLNSMV